MIDSMKTHGAFSWNELMTDDVEASKAFYGELFGWTLTTIDADGMEYTMAKIGDAEVAGMMANPEDAKGMPSAWGGYVTVDDVDASIAKAVKLGAQVCMEPKQCGNVGRFAVIMDPRGAALTLVTYSEKG